MLVAAVAVTPAMALADDRDGGHDRWRGSDHANFGGQNNNGQNYGGGRNWNNNSNAPTQWNGDRDHHGDADNGRRSFDHRRSSWNSGFATPRTIAPQFNGWGNGGWNNAQWRNPSWNSPRYNSWNSGWTSNGWNNGYTYGGYGNYYGGYRRHDNSVALGVGIGILGLAVAAAASNSAHNRDWSDDSYSRSVTVGRDTPRAYPEPAYDASLGAAYDSSCLQSREYQTTIIVGGVKQRAYGTACLQPDGTWRQGPPQLEPR
jgi:hypothetical protein